MGKAWPEPEKALADDPDFIRLRAPLIALEQVQVIDGTGAPPKENQIILIKNGRIQAIGDVGDDSYGHPRWGQVSRSGE